MRLRRLLPALLGPSIVLFAGCGDDSPSTGGGGGGGSDPVGGQGGDGGSGGSQIVAPAVESAHAPDEVTVVVQLSGDDLAPPEVGTAYLLKSASNGDLTVGDVTFDPEAKTVTLVTSKQKLGVEYSVTIKAPGDPLDLANATFMSADTVTLWASDFTDNFTPYQVTAERQAVGEHVVIYTTPDAPASDVDETVQYFDEKIFPVETALFTDAPDRDGNGKILLLGLDGMGQYGGYFDPTNSLTDAQAQQFGGHSNEMEMLYISTVDLGGALDPVNVVAHEFQHLLYNETHDFFTSNWSWHNEGLAECAVNAVEGANAIAAAYYLQAPGLADGESLVRWTYSNYDQYAQAYVFWTYVAGRLGGVDGYGQLFDLSGDPADIGAFFQDQFGQSMPEVQLDMLTATFVQSATGQYGFNGMLDLGGAPQTASGSPRDLETYTGVLFDVNGAAVSVAGAGPDVVHRGVSSDGTIDDSAPFAVSAGVLIALNAKEDPDDTTTESSGTVLSAGLAKPSSLPLSSASRHGLWLHPPPVHPGNRAALFAWRRAVHGY